MPQQLGSKDASLFRQVVKNYEQKQYKKGVKAADQILKKNQNHGDTQAMKALIINALGETDEAFTLAKLALKNDMKSHVCWHVYGLLYRSQKNYEEAAKSYKMALRLEPESPQILRDLSLLQAQLRDYKGYADSRYKMLQKRDNLRQNWTALAIAEHLNGNLAQAEKVLKLYEDTLKQAPPKTDIEHNEAVLYRNSIIAEAGDLERALEHLESIEKNTLDRTAVMEMRADYLLRLGRNDDAAEAYRQLLDRNNEYTAYYEGLEQALGLNRSNKTALKELYESYAAKDERLDAARRIPLDFLEGDDFHKAADQYLRYMLRRGVPSTFSNVKFLYTDDTKRKTIQSLVESYQNEKQVNGSSDDSSGDKFEKAVLYFLAQHYKHKSCRDLKKALQFTEKLIEMAPKTYDWHMNKARIYKHYGNPVMAAQLMDHARSLDEKDRYINTKCAKYQLKNDENERALNTMSKFTRNDVVGGTLGDLIEMQAVWYLLEDAEAYARQCRFGLALKRYHTILSIFDTWHEDQFDFHTFSLRKAQIRAYVQMLRWEDRLQEHPYFQRAAAGTIRVYLKLFDDPSLSKESLTNGANGSADSKALKKARLEQERKEASQREADRKVASKKGNLGQDGEVKKSDQDPRGLKFLETKDPLGDAMKIISPLLEFSPLWQEGQILGFEVYRRRNKILLALKCLLYAFEIDPLNPAVHVCAFSFRHTLSQKPEFATPTVLDLANTQLPAPYNKPLDKGALKSVNDDYGSAHSASAAHSYAFVRAQKLLDPASGSSCHEHVLKVWDTAKHITLDDAVEGILLLRELEADDNTVEKFVRKATDRFPEAANLFERRKDPRTVQAST